MADTRTFASCADGGTMSVHSGRDTAIDIAKAFAILLMVVGHCSALPWAVLNLILSFHMPLFFIFSGYFYRPKPLREVFFQGNRHLLKPYLIATSCCVLLCLTAQNIDEAKYRLLGIVMCNGGFYDGRLLPNSGALWFLPALYWCKIFYAWLSGKTRKCFLWSFMLSMVALLVGRFCFNLPLGLLVGMSGMVYYAIGHYWHSRLKVSLNKVVLLVGIAVWLYCAHYEYLNMFGFACSLYPVSMFAAFIGTYVTWMVACKTPRTLRPVLCWIGRNTLLVLCYHRVNELVWMNMGHWLFKEGGILYTPQTEMMYHDPILATCVNLLLTLTMTYLHTRLSRCNKV